MKSCSVALLSMLCISCNDMLTSGNPGVILEEQATVWICHNPESDLHGKVCPAEQDNPCLSRGDSTKFCWELDIEDCRVPENVENIEFCKELMKNEQ